MQMNSLAVKSYAAPARRSRGVQRLVIGAILLCLTGAIVLGGMSLVHGPSAPKRQVARIMLLPDTPPPPPPPEDKKPPPPKEVATPQQVNMPVPKVETPPEPAQLKMEGEAGTAPSMFASGDVKQEYIGGDIGNGSRYAAYVARLEQRVQARNQADILELAYRDEFEPMPGLRNEPRFKPARRTNKEKFRLILFCQRISNGQSRHDVAARAATRNQHTHAVTRSPS